MPEQNAPHIIIRPECPNDEPVVHALTERAFAQATHSDGTEQFIIDELRRQQALTLSLIAEMDKEMVGHVAFSPVTVDGAEAGVYALGPISVSPDYQKKGIGSMLVKSGLEQIKSMGARAVVLAGDPAWYSRFGFETNESLRQDVVPGEYFLALPYKADFPGGFVRFHPAFFITPPKQEEDSR